MYDAYNHLTFVSKRKTLGPRRELEKVRLFAVNCHFSWGLIQSVIGRSFPPALSESPILLISVTSLGHGETAIIFT